MEKYAVIVAGGAGTRMGSSVPKQFLLLDQKPVIYHTLQAFLSHYEDLRVILVLPEAHMDAGRQLVETYFKSYSIKIVAGGETRFQSVKNGLALVEEESIVFVHDGVRCLLTGELIQRCYDMALATGSAIPVVASKDSVRLLSISGSEPLDRNKVMLVQTPQTFHNKIILPAFQIEYKTHFTDEATVVEAFGIKVSLVEGEDNNIKITKPVDLTIAEEILAQRRLIGTKDQ